jgi:putative intracellular protease/amidase
MAHVLVVCTKSFNPNELWPALRTMRKRGHTFEVVSTQLLVEEEKGSRVIQLEHTIDDIDYEGFDGLLVIAGDPKDRYEQWENKKLEQIVARADERHDVLGAICTAVPSIRGAVRGKQVSFFPLVRAKELLGRAGAILTTLTVVRDDNIVTAEFEAAAHIWIDEFCNALEGIPPQYVGQDTGFSPKGGPRKPIQALENLKKHRKETDGEDSTSNA